MIGSDVGGGIGSAVGGIIGLATAGDGGAAQYQQAIKAWKKLQTSDFDMRSLTAPELQLVATYFPEEYNAVAPPELQQAQDSAQGRGAQLDALNYFQGIQQKGLPLDTRLATEEAQRSLALDRRASQDAIMSNLQARGRLGSGTELAARIGAGQQDMDLARDMGSDLARQQIQARMQAAAQAGGIGSQLRSQDVGLSQFNADWNNRFNQWASEQMNQANQYNAGARERAGFANTGTRQDLSNQNALNRYNVDEANLNRQNALRDTSFGQNLAKTTGLANAYMSYAQQKNAEQAARLRNAQSIGQGVGSTVGSIYGG